MPPLPDGHETAHEPFPLLLMRHGGGGDKSALARLRPVIEEMWKSGALPPMVIATPSVTRSFYVDFRKRLEPLRKQADDKRD